MMEAARLAALGKSVPLTTKSQKINIDDAEMQEDTEKSVHISRKSTKTTRSVGSQKSMPGKAKTRKGPTTKINKNQVLLKRDAESWKYKNGLHTNLTPINNIEDIIAHIVGQSISGLQEVMNHLDGRPLRVATLCSGTESPILFLRELSTALADQGHFFQFEHVFSAEIEPFKQAYIERNFHPPILFRDITQFINDGPAETAFGSTAELPVNVDLLVAGFSCVDFSNLNAHKKSLQDDGQSGQTAHGVLEYAKRTHVPLVVLENVVGAPWSEIGTMWQNAGYATKHIRLDTKEYYLPHTRQRGYMLCVLKSKAFGDDEASRGKEAITMLKHWELGMEKFKRPASTPFHEFLFDTDDPRLHKAQAEYTGKDKGNREVPWVRYEARHIKYRELNGFGHGRPVTEWRPNGSSTMIEFGNHLWMANEVQRVKDTLDISLLRSAARGYDLHSKSVVIDFSQGVDRQADTTPAGLVGCITPSGMPYYTLRGGLITGIEALRLQGIPTNELSLTRESQKELQNMAGNAMSTPVVGVAIIASLIAGIQTLPGSSSLAPRIDPPPPSTVFEAKYHIDDSDTYQLAQKIVATHIFDEIPAEELMSLAGNTVSKCPCEGPAHYSNLKLFTCKGCGHVACVKCRGTPHHNFEDTVLLTRECPSSFKENVIRALPMQLTMKGFCQDFDLPLECGDALGTFLKVVKRSIEDELKFSEMKRSQIWTVVYKSASSRLELRLSSTSLGWYYFVLPEKTWTGDRKERKLLEHPVGRMLVKGHNLLAEQWEFRWPVITTIDITIRQKKDSKNATSWLSKLGLPTYASDCVPMEIVVDTAGHLPEIEGYYMRLPDCGTACGCLYIRKSATQRTMALFLDPDFLGDPKKDRFVFSPNVQRLLPGQVRDVVASIPNKAFTQWLLTSITPMTFRGRIDQTWVTTRAQLTPVEKDVVINTPTQRFKLLHNVSDTDSKHCAGKFTPILTCIVPEVASNRGVWKQGPWLEVTDVWEHETFTSIAWLTSCCSRLDGAFEKQKTLNAEELGLDCLTCCPPPAKLKWKHKGPCCLPFEDPLDASKFESAIKARPKGVVAFTKKDEAGRGHLLLGIHVPTLAHRALAGLAAATQIGYVASHNTRLYQENPEVSWSLCTSYDLNLEVPQPVFTLLNNDDDPEVMHVFKNAMDNTSTEGGRANSNDSLSKECFDEDVTDDPIFKNTWPPRLRPEQARSLHWMLSREDPNATLFAEQEAEEAYFAPLSWLLDVRATRRIRVLGGVVADGVGYGKTITTLALIDHQKTPGTVKSFDGRIPLKATLILVTAGTLPQWESEAKKFLGKDAKILSVRDMKDLRRCSLRKLKEVEVIIVAYPLITSNSYLDRLAQFAALPPPPTSQSSRAFIAWLQHAITKTKEHVLELSASPSLKHLWDKLCERRQNAEVDAALHEIIPYKREGSDDSNEGEETQEDEQGGGMSKKRKLNVKGSQAPKKTGRKSVTSIDTFIAEVGKGSYNSNKGEKVQEDEQGGGTSKKRKLDVKGSQAPKKAGKKSVTRVDTFNMTKAACPDDMLGPLFEMLEFQRIVVDEFTYLGEKERASINSLVSFRRWILSGTPPLEDFADIQKMASFLGVYLGKDDLDKRATATRNIRKMQKERTAVEKFRYYSEIQSWKWHDRRHEIANEFLKQFVRKNLSSAKVSPAAVVLRIGKLTLAERAVYTELEAWLVAKNMNAMALKKAPYMSDRDVRVYDALYPTKSGELGLLWAASRMVLSGSEHDFEGVDADHRILLDLRAQHLLGLSKALQAVFRWTERLIAKCPDVTGTHYQDWVTTYKSDEFEDRSVGHAINEIKLRALTELDFEFEMSESNLLMETQKYIEHIVINDKADIAQRFSPDKVDTVEDHSRLTTFRKKLSKPETDPKLYFLRELTVKLSTLATQYIHGTRAFRYVNTLAFLRGICQKEVTVHCGHVAQYPVEVYVLIICGHTICRHCFAKRCKESTCLELPEPEFATHAASSSEVENIDSAAPQEIKCVIEGCNAHMTDVRPAEELLTVGDVKPEKQGCFRGSKIYDIVKLIKEEIPTTAQVIVFAQNDLIMEAISQALMEKKISNCPIYESIARSATAGKCIEKFRLEGSKSIRVLLLNSANESCAGSNLQNANHVILVSPLHANSNYDYFASDTQCIGRASRQGQKKKVKLYRFLTLHTIDVDILEARTSERLVYCGSAGWEMKDGESLARQEKAKTYGTVIGRDFLPDRMNGGNEEEETEN